MKILEFGQDTTLQQILESIRVTQEDTVDLRLPKDSPILTNKTNKEIIEKYARKINKKLSFPSIDSTPTKGEEDFGFVEGQDIAEKKPEKIAAVSEVAKSHTQEEILEKEEPKKTVSPEVNKPAKGPLKFFKNLRGRKKLLVLGTGSIFLIMIILFGTFWFVPAAEVSIVVEKEEKSNQITLSASESVTEVDLENKIIPLTVEQITKSDVDTAETTGKLTIGAPAKGRVTIGNFSTVTSKKYSAGTTVKTVSGQNVGLEFTLDTEVTVPKASSSGFSIVAGQVGVNATAKKIGSEWNVPKSTEFQISNEDLGTVKGVNDVAFSGGESKQVSSVSEEDRKNLKEKLLEKLKKEVEEELENKIGGATVPKGGLETEILKEKYDKVIGEESKEVTLTLEVKAKATLFKEEDLKKILIESIKTTIKEGFTIDEENSTVEAELFKAEGEEGVVEILGKINAVLIPDLSEEDLKSKLTGKSFGGASSFLQSLENVSGFEIELKPAIFRLFKILPFNSGRINVNISSEEITTESPSSGDSEETSKEEGEEEDAESVGE